MTSGVESTVSSNRSLLTTNFAMTVPDPSTAGGDDAGTPEKSLASRVAAGPGAREDEERLATCAGAPGGVADGRRDDRRRRVRGARAEEGAARMPRPPPCAW